MSADAIVPDPDVRPNFPLRCHKCGKAVLGLVPRVHHPNCLEPDGSLLVSFDPDNVELL